MKEINLRHSKNELAQRRWKILARALFKNVAVDDVIFSSKFHSFNLFKVCAIEIKDNEKSEWFRYSAFINDVLIFVKIRHLSNRTITRDELVGFNNTGNLCVWPSEEVLAYYVICNKSLFDNKKVLEVGGGMTCLSAILVAKYTNCLCTHMSDGNESSVQNVSRIVKENGIDKVNVSCFVLKWNSYRNHTEKYDVILCADCIFFEESRSDLINTLWHLLLNSGIAIITAPKRDSSLAKFFAEAVQVGFNYSLYCYYNDQVWKKHVQFLECDENYNPNIHYPLLIILTKYSIILK